MQKTDKKKREFSDRQILTLRDDKEFCANFKADPEMCRLDSIPRRTVSDRLGEIGLSFGGMVQLADGIFVQPPTAGALLLLATVESPYIISGPRRLLDVDVCAWILNEGRDALTAGLTVDDIEQAAAGWMDEAGVDRVHADEVLVTLINLAFKSLEMLPSTGGDRRCLFDLPWYSWVTSTVASTTGFNVEYVGWRMPLGLAMHYIVAEKRRQGVEAIHQTPNELIIERTRELMRERIKEKGYKY